jgi:hypothetical protein
MIIDYFCLACLALCVASTKALLVPGETKAAATVALAPLALGNERIVVQLPGLDSKIELPRDGDPVRLADEVCTVANLDCTTHASRGEVISLLRRAQQIARENVSIPLLQRSMESSRTDVDDLAGSTFWKEQIEQLQACIVAQPRQFLRCHVIQFLMFVGNSGLANAELAWLKANKKLEWIHRAIEESFVGNPYTVQNYSPMTSANALHHAYAAARFEDSTSETLENMEVIVEFGGGYGSFARVAFQAGFKGKFVIHDLHPFSLLQRHFLFSLGIPVREHKDWNRYNTGVWFTSTMDELAAFHLREIAEATKHTMMVGMFSLSEVSVELRESFFSAGPGAFHNFLFFIQPSWRENSKSENLDWFLRFMFHTRPDLAWHSWQDKGICDNRYICGSWRGRGAMQQELDV